MILDNKTQKYNFYGFESLKIATFTDLNPKKYKMINRLIGELVNRLIG
jgi:hypothetical protein